MRLILLLVFGISLLGQRGYGAIDVPVEADTFAHAFQTATATPNSEIHLSAPVTEAVSVGANNTSLTITGNGMYGSSIYLNTSNSTFTVGSGLVTPLVIKNLKIVHGATSGGNTFQWTGLGVGSTVLLQNVWLDQRSTTNACVFLNVILTTPNQFTMNIYKVTRTGASQGVRQFAAIVSTDVINLRNGLLINETALGEGFNNSGSVHTSSIWKITNATVSGFDKAYSSVGVGTVVNTIFTGCTTSQSLTAPASTSDFTYMGRTNSIANPGTGSITITSARTFCDPVNYYISPASLTLNAGVSIDGVTGVDVGLNGVMQGSGGIYGMGCNPYSIAFCGGYNGR